jgi:hypothetical protein
MLQTRGQPTLGYPTLGEMIALAGNQDVLGISDRDAIIGYLLRAIELIAWKANWDPYLGDMDICSDSCGRVTLPSEVGVPLAVNVGGFPAYFRNSWFKYHINGPGDVRGMSAGSVVGPRCGYVWDDELSSPTFQDLTQYCYMAAIVEDPVDGNGSLSLQVMGETMDPMYNQKMVVTIPPSGPSQPGVMIPLLTGYASTDAAATQFRKITRVIKPVTRGYVKLIGFPGVQQAQGVTIGYYAPNETDPSYRRIRVNASCKWVRLRYRRSEIKFVYDTDIIPLPCREVLIELLKAVRMRDAGDIDGSDKYVHSAVTIMLERQLIEEGPANFSLQVDPAYGLGTIDYR